MADFPRKITDDPYGAAILIRRLATEQGAAYWRRYLLAFALMGIAAGATSLSAYLLGEAINKAYVDKNIPGIALYSAIIFFLFLIRGIAIYQQTVTLSRISNAILANNQRKLFAKLRKLRKAIADEENIPPYVVFNDATLIEMAEQMPLSPGDMLSVNGVGTRKLERFGQEFMALIRAHVDGDEE